jgi:hypothetical protein
MTNIQPFSRIWILFVLWACWANAMAIAQPTADTGEWFALFAQGDLERVRGDSPNLKWWFDGHLRLLDDTGGYNQSILRPGVGAKISERSVAWVGYAFIHTNPLSGIEFDEHRLWQQITWSETQGPWTLALRSRLEQRFLETGDDLGWRFRQLVRVQRSLAPFPRLSLVGWDEAFFHLNDTDFGANAGFDQNRAFAGLGFKRNPDGKGRVEFGYLNQAIDVPSGNDRTHHLLSINVFF